MLNNVTIFTRWRHGQAIVLAIFLIIGLELAGCVSTHPNIPVVNEQVETEQSVPQSSTVAVRECLTHVVQPREGLAVIARIYGVGVPEIVALNNIQDQNLIQPGQTLRISPCNKTNDYTAVRHPESSAYEQSDQNRSAFADNRSTNTKGTLENPIIDSDVDWESIKEAAKRRGAPPQIIKRQTLITVQYYSFDDKIHQGQLIIDQRLVNDITAIFAKARELKFPIQSVIPISKFGWSDSKSMAANNTTSFDYRPTTSGKKLSNHAYGQAIDINPLYNPYIYRGNVEPDGAVYDTSKKGTFTANSPMVKAFARLGWRWGGSWKHVKDYQHFEKRL